MTFFRPIALIRNVSLHALWACIAAGAAHAQCSVLEDANLYEDRKQQSILLMQFGDVVVRATDGKIRCNPNNAGTRQVCKIEGQGEMLVEGREDRFVVRLDDAAMHEVHISSAGAVTCQP